MRTVGAELGAAAAGEQGIPSADRPGEEFDAHPPAILGDQIPARERQRVEVVDLLADDVAVQDLALRQPHHRGFGLAVEDEIAVFGEQLGHLRRRDADEPDLHAARAHPVGPRRLVLVVDKRRQYQRHVAVEDLAARPFHVVARAVENRRDIGHVDARHVMEPLLEIRHHGRHARKRIEPRSVSTDHRVLADKTSIGFQVRENDLHSVTSI